MRAEILSPVGIYTLSELFANTSAGVCKGDGEIIDFKAEGMKAIEREERR